MTNPDRYRPLTVSVPDVPGRALGGAEWEGSGYPVLGIQGLTSNHRLFELLAREIPDHRLVAEDARGRASGAGIPAPRHIDDHADDLVRLLDQTGIDRALVVGHSMGGFIGLRFAQLHPDRVQGLVLLDGGPPVKLPGILRSRWAVKTAFKRKLGTAFSQTYTDVDDFRRWLSQRADSLGNLDPDFIRWGFAIDLAGPAGKLTLQQDLPTLQEDAADCFTAPWRGEALRSLPMPGRLLLAEFGEKPGSKPLYRSDPDPSTLSPTVAFERLAGVDHVQILTDPRSVAAIESLVPGGGVSGG